MALTKKSLFVYGIEVTPQNRSLDFKVVSGGPEQQATLRLGYYSGTSLCEEIVRAMSEANPNWVYTATVDRSYALGLENRVIISTTSTFLSLLFATGSRVASTVAPLIGFLSADKTGATSYTGVSTIGTVLIPSLIGYNWKPPETDQEVQGSRSISASGIKEAIVFQIQEFFTVEFKHEPKSRLGEWQALFRWLIQQRPFEFTPESDSYNTFYEGTLEKTAKNATGLGYSMTEQLPQFPNYYTTGLITFRKRVSGSAFIL